MLAATACVVVLPIVVVWSLPTASDPIDILASIALSMLLSLGVSELGARAWRRYPLSADILFSDLLIWGWVRRLRLERRLETLSRETTLASATRTGPVSTAQLDTLQGLCERLEARDPHTRRHSARVARHAVEIGRRLSLSPVELNRLKEAALLHDVGKLHTPRAVLNKPGRLTDAEFAVVKRHPGDGADMLMRAGVHPATVAMVRSHHERLSGSGYPDGLAGAEIPIGARIIAVADTFDAITSSRPYRAARPHEEAIRVLRQEAGRELDAAAVDAFVDYYTGRRQAGFWGIGSGLAGGLAPVRQFVTQVGSGTAAPVLAASAFVAAPALTVAAGSQPVEVERGAIAVADVSGSAPGMPTPTTVAVGSPDAGTALAQRFEAVARVRGDGGGRLPVRGRGERILLTGPDGRTIASLPAADPRPARAGHSSTAAPAGPGHAHTPGPEPQAPPASAPQPPATVVAPDPVLTPQPQSPPTPQATPRPEKTPRPERTPRPRPTPRPAEPPAPAKTPRPQPTPRPLEPGPPAVESPEPVGTPRPEKTPRPADPEPPAAETPEPVKTPKPEKDPKDP